MFRARNIRTKCNSKFLKSNSYLKVTNTVIFLESGKTKNVNAPFWWSVFSSSVGNKDETNEFSQPFLFIQTTATSQTVMVNKNFHKKFC